MSRAKTPAATSVISPPPLPSGGGAYVLTDGILAVDTNDEAEALRAAASLISADEPAAEPPFKEA